MKTSKKILSLFVIMCMALTMLAGTFTVSAAETTVFSLTPSNAAVAASTKVFTFTGQPATITLGSNVADYQSLATADDVAAYPGGVEVGDMKTTNFKTVIVTNPLATASNLQLSADNPIGRIRYVVYYPSAVTDLNTAIALAPQYSMNGSAKGSTTLTIGTDGKVSFSESAFTGEESNSVDMVYDQYVTFEWEYDFSESVTSPTFRGYFNGTLVGETTAVTGFTTYSDFAFSKLNMPSTAKTDAKSTHFIKEFSWTVMSDDNSGEEPPVDPEPTTYEVKFMDGETQIGETQTIAENGFATEETAPAKDGYTFSHWSLTDGGAEVNVTTYAITAATTFYAVFTQNSQGGDEGDDFDHFTVPTGYTPTGSNVIEETVASVTINDDYSFTSGNRGILAGGVRLNTNAENGVEIATEDDAAAYEGVTAGDFKLIGARSFPDYVPETWGLDKSFRVAVLSYQVYYPSTLKGTEFLLKAITAGGSGTRGINITVGTDGNATGDDDDYYASTPVRFDGWNTFDFVADFSDWDGVTVKKPMLSGYVNGVKVCEFRSARSFDSLDTFYFNNASRFINTAIEGEVAFTKGFTMKAYAPDGYYPEFAVTKFASKPNTDTNYNDVILTCVNTTGNTVAGTVLAVIKDANGFVTSSYSASLSVAAQATDAGKTFRSKVKIPNTIDFANVTFYVLTDLSSFAPLAVSSAEL